MRTEFFIRSSILIILIFDIVVCVDTVIVVHVTVGGGAINSTMMSIATTPTKPRLSNELQDTYDPYNNCDDDDDDDDDND